MNIRHAGLILIATIIVTACDPSHRTSFVAPDMTEDPVSFDARTDGFDVVVTKNTKKFAQSGESMATNARSFCGDERPEEYFMGVAKAFAGREMIDYAIEYRDASQRLIGFYELRLLPNAMAYTNFDQFGADFASCGESMLPVALNESWMALGMPCWHEDIPYDECMRLIQPLVESIELQ